MTNYVRINKLSKAQQAFTSALLDLMKKKPYKDITVSELSEYCGYDRRTYYRYFKTMDDVIRLHCAYLLKEMAEIMISKGMLTPETGFLSYFEFWDRHRDFLILLDQQGLLYFLGELQNSLLYQQVGLSMHSDLPDELSDTSEFSQFAFHFMLGGVWSSLVFWVRSGMKQTPEQLTKHILNSLTEMAKLIK